jgi:hypothetical protein
VAAKLTRPFHIPRLPRPDALGVLPRHQARPAGSRGLVGLGSRCRLAIGSVGLEKGARPVPGWPGRAVGEGLLAALVTTLLTSSVLAAPEAFRQSPLVTWRQLTTPALAAGELPGHSVLLDCP